MGQDNKYFLEEEVVATDAYKRRLEGQGIAQKEVRWFNRQLILVYVREHGPVMRAKVAKDLELSRATVTSIVRVLLDKKLLREEKGKRRSTEGGRQIADIVFNADFGRIVGIDLGRSRFRIYLTNLAAEIKDQSSSVFDERMKFEEILVLVADKVRELVERHPGAWSVVRGIGMGLPGSVDRQGRFLISPPLLEHWGHVDIPARLRELLGCEPDFPIHLDNDANMGAIGESRYGKGYGVRNMLYIKLSTGIGVGLILNGALYRGENGVAGEFGHIRVQSEEVPTEEARTCLSCGKKGCLEALAGLHAIIGDARGDSSSSSLRSLSEQTITPEHMVDVIMAALHGDEASSKALERAGNRIGAAIGSYLINVYNPALILLDGGIVRPSKGGKPSINTPFLEALKQSARKSSLPAAWDGTIISTGSLGDDAVGRGAAALVIDRDPELNMPTAI